MQLYFMLFYFLNAYGILVWSRNSKPVQHCTHYCRWNFLNSLKQAWLRQAWTTVNISKVKSLTNHTCVGWPDSPFLRLRLVKTMTSCIFQSRPFNTASSKDSLKVFKRVTLAAHLQSRHHLSTCFDSLFANTSRRWMQVWWLPMV
jgi:hypothetical protein